MQRPATTLVVCAGDFDAVEGVGVQVDGTGAPAVASNSEAIVVFVRGNDDHVWEARAELGWPGTNLVRSSWERISTRKAAW